MQIFNIHNQIEFTKNNGHDSPIVYRIERSWTNEHATMIFVPALAQMYCYGVIVSALAHTICLIKALWCVIDNFGLNLLVFSFFLLVLIVN